VAPPRLDRGDLALVKASAAQLPAVDLPTALEITLLIASEEPHNAERPALRWLCRRALESREATLEGLLAATVALSALAHEPERWEAALRKLVNDLGKSRSQRREPFLARGVGAFTAPQEG
jgi:hypothetical protein